MEEAGATAEAATLVGRLGHSDPAARKDAYARLVGLGAAAVPALCAALRDSLGPRRAAVAEVLVDLAPVSLPALAELAADPDREVRLWVAWVLGRAPLPESVEPLAALTRDPDAEVRRMAVTALAGLGVPGRTRHLAAVLRDSDAAARREAVTALGETGDPAAVGPTCTALADADAGVRRAAAAALGRLRDPRAVAALLSAAAANYDEAFQAATIEALGAIGDPAALEPLCRVLREGQDSVAELAAAAVARLGAAAVGPLCDLLPGLRGFGNAPRAVIRDREADGLTRRGQLVLRALMRLGREAVPALAGVLTREDTEHARYEAAWVLAEIARRDPCIELRAALAPLRAGVGPFSGQARYIQDRYREAITAIEAATEALADIPRPAGPAPPAAADLPRPAGAPEPAAADLPRAAAGPTG